MSRSNYEEDTSLLIFVIAISIIGIFIFFVILGVQSKNKEDERAFKCEQSGGKYLEVYDGKFDEYECIKK